MYKKHKWFSELRNFRAFNQLRQICDLTGCFKSLNLCLIAHLAQCKLTSKSFEITNVFYTNVTGKVEDRVPWNNLSCLIQYQLKPNKINQWILYAKCQ